MKYSVEFEKQRLHPELFRIKRKDDQNIIGFITKHPTGSWFWFTNHEESIQRFHDELSAIESLVHSYVDILFPPLTAKQDPEEFGEKLGSKIISLNK